MMWTEKYRPKKLREFVGQDKALTELKRFLISYRKGKAALLYGKTGTGKTSSVYAIANEMNLEILEVNASDTRNKNEIEDVLGNSVKQVSLFGKKKIILVDDIDGIAGQQDRGGIQAIMKIISESSYPLILTSNEPYTQKFSSLRKKCSLIEFNPVDYKDIEKLLEKISEEENLKLEKELLKKTAIEANGDVRAAVNDIYILSLHKGNLDHREKKDNISNVLRIIFKTKEADNVLKIFDRLDTDVNEIVLWIDENLPKEYRNNDLVEAYNIISRADVYNGRIRRQQHWRFLVYIYSLLGAGIATAKEEKSREIVKYERTKRILKMWMAKNRLGKRNSIAEKIAERTHDSRKKVLKDTMPYIKFIAEDIKGDLDEEEIIWLKK